MPKLMKEEGKLNLVFYCPGCKCHHGVSTTSPQPTWTWNGDMDKPTFSPSIKVTMGPKPDPETHLAPKGAPKRVCHSFIRNGEIQFLNDCTHELAGKTVELPDIDDD